MLGSQYKRLTKKSVMSKAFLYAFSLFIAGFILYLAYYGVTKINKTRCEAQTISAIKELKQDLEEKYSVYGIYKKYTVPMICKAGSVCFLNSTSSFKGYDPHIVNVVYLRDVDTDPTVLSSSEVVGTAFVSNLEVESGAGISCVSIDYPCVMVKGRGDGASIVGPCS